MNRSLKIWFVRIFVQHGKPLCEMILNTYTQTVLTFSWFTTVDTNMLECFRVYTDMSVLWDLIPGMISFLSFFVRSEGASHAFLPRHTLPLMFISSFTPHCMFMSLLSVIIY